MPYPVTFDDEARAELLCYLVVAQLVATAHTGEWLRSDHLVESARIWLASNGARCDWQERLKLARASEELAPEFHRLDLLRDLAYLTTLFTDGWRLDYRSPAVHAIYDVCAARLAQ